MELKFAEKSNTHENKTVLQIIYNIEVELRD